MPRYPELAEALRCRDVNVVEAPGWQTRGSVTFQPRGVVVHHTGPGSTKGLIDLCIRGRSDLPGPLCQILLDPNGVAYVLAAGRANHAGAGEWRGLVGNTSVFGIEAVHTGSATQPWPTRQLEAYYRCCAALLDLMKLCDARSVCGHKEWAPGRKIDPIRLDMSAFRARVTTLLMSEPGLCVIGEAEGMKVDTHAIGWDHLDAKGRGWVDVPFPFARVLSVIGQGSDGSVYWPPIICTGQPYGNVTRVTLAGAPGQGGQVYAKVLVDG